MAVPGRIFRGPAQQLLRLVPSLTDFLCDILSRNQTTNKVLSLRNRLLLPVRPRQCHRRLSIRISLARTSLLHHLHWSNHNHLPSPQRQMEEVVRNQSARWPNQLTRILTIINVAHPRARESNCMIGTESCQTIVKFPSEISWTNDSVSVNLLMY